MRINILVVVGIAGYAMAPLYKYMWTYLAVDRISPFRLTLTFGFALVPMHICTFSPS
jgi:hypothetical protein